MGLWDGIKAVAHQFIPGGETYASYYQKKRRRDEEQARWNNSQNWNNNRNSNYNSGSNISVGVATPNQNIVVEKPKPKRPTNVFQDLNKNLVFNRPQTTLEVLKNENTKVEPKPAPGTIIKPTLKVDVARPKQRIVLPKRRPETNEDRVNRGLDRGQSWEDIARENRIDVNEVRKFSQATRPNYGIKVEKPQQSIGDRFRDIFDANTEADQWRRQEGNRLKGENKDIVLRNPGNLASRTPIVGHVLKAGNTLKEQAQQLVPTTANFFATKEQSAATEEYRKAVESGDKQRIINAKARLNDATDRVTRLNREQEEGFEGFEKNKGGLFNVGTLYDKDASRRGDLKTGITDIALPSAVAGLDLYTLGRGNALYEAIKQKGRAALPGQAGNIGKISVGNYASGDLDARSQGATNEQAIKSGLISSVLGLAPDLGLPALTRSIKNRVLPQVFKGRRVNPKDAAEELDEAAISASAEAANQALRPKPIRVTQNIPVSEIESMPQPVRVRNLNEPKPLIKEFPGDANVATPDPLIQRFADESRENAARDRVFEENRGVRPDQRIEGVTPRKPEPVFKLTDTSVKNAQDTLIDDYAGFLRQVGEGNGVSINPVTGTRISNNARTPETAGKRMTKAMWRDEAERQLRAGKAEPGIQKQFDEAADPEVQSLAAKGEQPPVEEGRPIPIKQENSIPVVEDNTVVPRDLPETPGTVRATTSVEPVQAKSEAVAQAPVTRTPPPLPSEVEEVLANPKKFNKRQVAAARNQRKLARQYAKTQEDTASAIARAEEASVRTPQADIVGREGFVPTGEFAKSSQRRGGVYETASREAEVAAGRQEMATRSAEDLVNELQGRRSIAEADQSKIQAAKENLVKADPDGYRNNPLWQILDNRRISDRRKAAQILALGDRVIRKTATSDTLATRWYNKVLKAVDSSEISEIDLKNVQKANDEFTKARDNAAALAEQYKRTRSSADLKAFEQAQKQAEQADLKAKTVEVKAAQNTLKGKKGDSGAKVINDLEKEAELNMMDPVTASQLSGPATGMRNLYGTELAGIENRLFANTRAKITNKLFDNRLINKVRPGEVNVGGYSRKGARAGRKEGVERMVDDARRRSNYSGRNPFKHARNFATTINTLGESSLQSQKMSRLYKYYENQLKNQGITGEQLKNDTKFLSLTDPDNMADQYMDAAMKASGLSGIYQKSRQIELQLAESLASKMDGVIPAGAANAIAKGITRIALGYPTATGNFIIQSGRRATLGLPSFAEVGWKLGRGDKAGAATAFDRGLKEAGGGAAGIGVGMALGTAGLVSGFYPEDEDERAEWEREGKNELSIKIGDGWYPIPQGFGMFGLPLIVGSTLADGGPDAVAEVLTDREKIFKLLPADQLYGVMQIASGDSTDNQNKAFVASTIRSMIPVGSFLNQTAKGLDQTANDTTTKDFWSNVMDQVISGIPGQHLFADIPDKKDDVGNSIKNPNLAQVYSGAQTVEQGAGKERSAQIQGEISSKLEGIAKYGVFDDPILEGILDEENKQLYNRAKNGEELDESDVKKLQEALVKGVSSEGTDTAYLERGEHDTNLAVLNMKRDLMKADPTTKPSSIEDVEFAIKEGTVYRDNQIPYEVIKNYKDTSLTEWRNMGDPDDEDYNPEMYEMLWKMDELMTKAKVSDNYKGLHDKPKYSAKTSGGRGRGRGGGRGGRGGRGSSSDFIADFGTLKDSQFAPRVQAYETIDQKAGEVPVIRRVRPNIVHKITSSG